MLGSPSFHLPSASFTRTVAPRELHRANFTDLHYSHVQRLTLRGRNIAFLANSCSIPSDTQKTIASRKTFGKSPSPVKRRRYSTGPDHSGRVPSQVENPPTHNPGN